MRYLLAIMLIILICLLASKSSGTGEGFMAVSAAFVDEGKVTEITDKDVLSNNWEKHKYAIVDMYATWCGPCHEFHPKFVETSKKYGDKAFFATIDIDKNPGFSASFDIHSIPTVTLFKDGIIVKKFTYKECVDNFDKAVGDALNSSK